MKARIELLGGPHDGELHEVALVCTESAEWKRGMYFESHDWPKTIRVGAETYRHFWNGTENRYRWEPRP